MSTNDRHTLTVYVSFRDAAKAVAFYKTAFGAEEAGPRIVMPDGRIGHTELRFGDSTLMISDEFEEVGARSVEGYGGSPLALSFLVDDVDAATARAERAGAIVSRPPEDQFYGDRTAWIVDPFGLRWAIQTQIESLSGDEIARRAEALNQGSSG
jgi:PhnB protein